MRDSTFDGEEYQQLLVTPNTCLTHNSDLILQQERQPQHHAAATRHNQKRTRISCAPDPLAFSVGCPIRKCFRQRHARLRTWCLVESAWFASTQVTSFRHIAHGLRLCRLALRYHCSVAVLSGWPIWDQRVIGELPFPGHGRVDRSWSRRGLPQGGRRRVQGVRRKRGSRQGEGKHLKSKTRNAGTSLSLVVLTGPTLTPRLRCGEPNIVLS